jgi:hypothetical protein
MKKIVISVGILFLLVIVAVAMIWQDKQEDQTQWQKKFAFKDTANIEKIYMVDKSNQDVVLKRENGHWSVNEQYKAMDAKIDLLLSTIHDMTIKYPVSKKKRENVIKSLSTSATKVEIYTVADGDPARTFYVGGPTQGKKGTYMVRSQDSEIAKTPYVTHIPGFIGYLTPRFIIAEKEWRDLRMFTYNYNQIESIKVDYPLNTHHSFKVTKYKNNDVQVTKPQGGQSNQDQLITTAARRFLNSFQNLRAEAIETKYDKQDSILATTPYAVIEVTPFSGQSQVMTIYRKPVTPTTKQQFTERGKRKKYDTDRYFATLIFRLIIVCFRGFFGYIPLRLIISFVF